MTDTTKSNPTTTTAMNIVLLPLALKVGDGVVDSDALDTVIVADSCAICSVADAWSRYSAATADHVPTVPPFSVLSVITVNSVSVTRRIR